MKTAVVNRDCDLFAWLAFHCVQPWGWISCTISSVLFDSNQCVEARFRSLYQSGFALILRQLQFVKLRIFHVSFCSLFQILQGFQFHKNTPNMKVWNRDLLLGRFFLVLTKTLKSNTISHFMRQLSEWAADKAPMVKCHGGRLVFLKTLYYMSLIINSFGIVLKHSSSSSYSFPLNQFWMMYFAQSSLDLPQYQRWR